MSLAGKRIVITGIASGIGKESAKELKERGAYVIGIDRNECDEFVDEFIKADFMDPESILATANAISGNVDILFNSAGLPPTAPVVNVMTVNFVALRRFTELMIDKLNKGGAIVNMASLAGVGWPGAVDSCKQFIDNANFDNVESLCSELSIDQARCYFFSKEALVIWTMQNWNTWRERGIRLNAISPGPVDTPILPDFLETLGERAEEDMKIMGRAGTVEEIAKVVAFMCSDDSVWINGANIQCDGGMNAHIMQKVHGF